MAKSRTTKAKRSLGALPKGLIHRKDRKTPTDPGNPFEVKGRQKRPKWEVHNRPIARPKSTENALESLRRRQMQLRVNMQSAQKSNQFVDRRIGQYDSTMSREDQMLARLVKERTRQSHRSNRYNLDDDGESRDWNALTHKGKRLDPNRMEAIYSDDEDGDRGNLEAVDTELHFGGSGLSAAKNNPYGVSTSSDLSKVYEQRKTELDDLIHRRKALKAEKMQAKEAQIETVENLDEKFAELSEFLQFRKDQKRPTTPTPPTADDQEMKEWNVEVKKMMMKPKLKATDRTKTPEETAKEEAERLHELETRRLARMNGDFEEDDFSDISEDEERRETRVEVTRANNAGRLTEQGEAGMIPNKLEEGDRVRANYRAAEQYNGNEGWFEGKVAKVHVRNDGSLLYDVEYDDGDFEERVTPANILLIQEDPEKMNHNSKEKQKDTNILSKQHKAKDKARAELPFVFEVPTTLDALHEMIAKYATSGKDASTIIERIHLTNSVRLDHRNVEKMQNYYDVLMRRFVAVGDAMFLSGDGGKELDRCEQLNVLTKVMYAMAQDAPAASAAVWSRRIGFFQNSHAKRLRDSELVVHDQLDDRPASAWPSAGTLLLLRAMGHVFPVSDKRHFVVTPSLLLLGQIVAQTPVETTRDVIFGLFCCGLLLEYTKEAKRVVPESLGFVAGVIRLFSSNPGPFASPSLEAAYHVHEIQALRNGVSEKAGISEITKLRLENEVVCGGGPEISVAVLSAALDLVNSAAADLSEAFNHSSVGEVFSEVSDSLLSLKPKHFPQPLQKKFAAVASRLSQLCPSLRSPLRRSASRYNTMAIKSLAPRMQDPEKYSFSKDVGKKSVETAIDRTRREYKREHKAASRELRLDASFIEVERRTKRQTSDNKARAKRQKNYAWLEGEQASMNQQVALGGGLIKGGGMGAAKAKAKSGKIGIKKGGKF